MTWVGKLRTLYITGEWSVEASAVDYLLQLARQLYAWALGHAGPPRLVHGIITHDPPPATLLDLPDLAASVLLSYLDTKSLGAVALCCRDALPPLSEAFRCRFVLRLPLDAARNVVFLGAIAKASKPHDRARSLKASRSRMPLLANKFVVIDTLHAATLLPVRHRVTGIMISPNDYTRPGRPLRWHILAQFTALKRLVIENVGYHPVKLSLLSTSCPRLQELVVKNARNVIFQTGLNLPMLRSLHTEGTNGDAIALAVGLPMLQSLTVMMSLRTSFPEYVAGVPCLADVTPLKRLVVRGIWPTAARAFLVRHHETLREYAVLDDIQNPRLADIGRAEYDFDRSMPPEWTKMVNLCSLRLAWEQQTDLEPIAALRGLEHLQLVVAPTCLDCVPLRRLTRLRTLQIANGWVCDLVSYLPRLQKLVWEVSDSNPRDTARSTLWRRYSADDLIAAGSSCDERATLRELVVRGHVEIQHDQPSVERLIRHVEQLEVCQHNRVLSLLPAITRLRHLKRLAFRFCDLPSVLYVIPHRFSWACADSLEELYYLPRCHFDVERTEERPAPLPQWFSGGLPNLRVLASPFRESMATLAHVCPRLTHVHMPFSRKCEFSRTDRESLRLLCVVTLAITFDCKWLRRERGPGRALPSLQRIYHPIEDCLEFADGRGWSSEDADLVALRGLSAPWAHDWNTQTPQVRETFCVI